jgi:hypothetical protein
MTDFTLLLTLLGVLTFAVLGLFWILRELEGRLREIEKNLDKWEKK